MNEPSQLSLFDLSPAQVKQPWLGDWQIIASDHTRYAMNAPTMVEALRVVCCARLALESQEGYLAHADDHPEAINRLNACAWWADDAPQSFALDFDAQGYLATPNAALYIVNYTKICSVRFADGLAQIAVKLARQRGHGPLREVRWQIKRGMGCLHLILDIRHIPGYLPQDEIPRVLAAYQASFDPPEGDELDNLPLTSYARQHLRRAGIRTRQDAIALLLGVRRTRVNSATLAELRACFRLH
jgi:hypothetical protein